MFLGSEPSPSRTKLLTSAFFLASFHWEMTCQVPMRLTKWKMQQQLLIPLDSDKSSVIAPTRQYQYCSRTQASTFKHRAWISSCLRLAFLATCSFAKGLVKLKLPLSCDTRYSPSPKLTETTKGETSTSSQSSSSVLIPSPRRTRVLTLTVLLRQLQLVIARKVPMQLRQRCRKRQVLSVSMCAMQHRWALTRQYQYRERITESTWTAMDRAEGLLVGDWGSEVRTGSSTGTPLRSTTTPPSLALPTTPERQTTSMVRKKTATNSFIFRTNQYKRQLPNR